MDYSAVILIIFIRTVHFQCEECLYIKLQIQRNRFEVFLIIATDLLFVRIRSAAQNTQSAKAKNIDTHKEYIRNTHN